jgi:hypothetical protein
VIRAELGWRPAVTGLPTLVRDQLLGQIADR